ncbi:hypothetical protein B0H34DRAFT_56085 [Crassisporium funariophilum]|nr:hypothetical protein B0H34DRAFT_56085 [Crassisporium funariophilum]
MLKRQRQPSPPPSLPSVPLISDSPIHRDSKRRRTLPPVLDGASRGWASSRSIPNDDEEEYFSDDEIENVVPHDYSEQGKAEYKSANYVLRELHTLQQHRLMFASPSPSIPQSAFLSATNHEPNTTAHAYSIDPPRTKGQLPLPLTNERPWTSQTPMMTPIDKPRFHESVPLEEVLSVTEHYEETNKLLGSLFLSRRREIDPTNQARPS